MKSGGSRSARLTGMVVIVPLLLGAACSVLGLDSYEDERERLEAARAAWQATGIDSYSYVLRRLCFCGGGTQPARIVVESGQRVSATFIETGEPVPEAFEPLYLTVDELFDFVEDAIDRKAHEIMVTYDAGLGLPLSIAIDYEENTIDEEMAFEASQFEAAG